MPPGWSEYQRFRSGFISILDPELYTESWLDGEVWSGRFRLFSHADSAILVSLKAYPTGVREMHVEAAVGELSQLIGPTILLAENWARSIGCRFARIESREGWSRVMKRKGYLLYQTAIRKELS